jgi:hypothetical protein
MKKLWLVTIFLCFLFFVSACQLEPQDLLGKLQSYQQRLNKLIEKNQSTVSFEPFDNYTIPLSSSNPGMKSKNEYMTVYNRQRDNSTDVQLDSTLLIYRDLLDEVIEQLLEMEIEELEVTMTIEYQGYANLEANLKLSQSGGVVFKFLMEGMGQSFFIGLKMGYEQKNFYLMELSYYPIDHFTYYFEFVENNQMIHLRYSSLTYWYRYQNQKDQTFYEISDKREFGNSGSSLRWYNPKTGMRVQFHDYEGNKLDLIEYFNAKGRYFIYEENHTENRIRLTWQLLEATGWDYVFSEEDTSNTFKAIYYKGKRLFPEATLYVNLWDKFASVYATISVLKEDITDDMLNLSAYELTFVRQNLKLSDLEKAMADMRIESEQYKTYRGIDFTNSNLRMDLYEVIDQDIKPD